MNDRHMQRDNLTFLEKETHRKIVPIEKIRGLQIMLINFSVRYFLVVLLFLAHEYITSCIL